MQAPGARPRLTRLALVSPGGRSLRIILDVRQTSEGRFEGALRVQGSRVARTFDGIIELVGLLETCVADQPDVPGISGSLPLNPGDPPDGARPGHGLAFE